MTRSVPTEAEQRCGAALKQYLQANGRTVAELTYSDKPDLRLVVDGEPMACECVQIPPARIFSLVHSRFKQNESKHPGAYAVQVVWPKEAHVWVREAIAEKERLIPEYRNLAKVSEISLVIHTPTTPGMQVVDPTKLDEISQIRWAAAKAKTRFKAIYFYDYRKGLERLIPTEKSLIVPTYDFSDGYPTSGFLLTSVGPFVPTEEGAEYDFGEADTKVIIVPPVDPQFRRHKPHYVLQRNRYTVKTASTTAKITVTPIEDSPR